MSTNPNDFLTGGGEASAKFENVGDTITGTVVNQEVRQQTDYKTGDPLTWANGDPRMQLVVTLQTALKDDYDDNGLRNLYVKGSKKPGTKSLHDAVASAVRAAGAKGLEDGGTLTVTYVGAEPPPPSAPKLDPRKLYSATYETPDKAATSGAYLGTVPVTESAPAPTVTAQPHQDARTVDNSAQLAAFEAWQKSQAAKR